MGGLRFYFKVLLNSISVESGRLAGFNEKLSAMEPCLRPKRSPPQTGSIPGPLVKEIRKVSQNVVPLHNGFMTLLCNYQCDMGYFL